MNPKAKMKIVVVSVMTSVELVAAGLIFGVCLNTNTMSSIPYIYVIMLFTYMIAIYGLMISGKE